MVLRGTSSNDEADSSAASTLPLFRAEAMAAQQQKFYGEIILIHPFSLTFLTMLAVFIASIVFGFLLLGQYTTVAHVSGILPASYSPSDQRSLANLYVPAQALPFARPGEDISIHCSACTPHRQSCTVQKVSTSPLQPAEVALETGILSKQPLYRVTVALFHNNFLPSRTVIEANLPVNRKPLLRWLFERPGS
jgi:hypothetical protein